jgi:hypothetical protein
VENAKTGVGLAFNAVLAADKAGANITRLLAQLNTASGILAQAENFYRIGDSNTAAALADRVLPIVKEVITAAQNAKQGALNDGQNAFFQLIAFTAICVSVFVFALFLVWRRLKRGYFKSLSESRTEMTANEP